MCFSLLLLTLQELRAFLGESLGIVFDPLESFLTLFVSGGAAVDEIFHLAFRHERTHIFVVHHEFAIPSGKSLGGRRRGLARFVSETFQKRISDTGRLLLRPFRKIRRFFVGRLRGSLFSRLIDRFGRCGRGFLRFGNDGRLVCVSLRDGIRRSFLLIGGHLLIGGDLLRRVFGRDLLNGDLFGRDKIHGDICLRSTFDRTLRLRDGKVPLVLRGGRCGDLRVLIGRICALVAYRLSVIGTLLLVRALIVRQCNLQ